MLAKKASFLLLPLVLLAGISSQFLTAGPINLSYPVIGVSMLFFLSNFLRGCRYLRFANKASFSVYLLYLLPFVSLTWTQSITASLDALIPYFVVLYFVLVSLGLAAFSTEKFVKLLMLSSLVVCASSTLVVILFPGLGLQPAQAGEGTAWTGIFDHKNSLGRNAGLGFVSALLLFGLGRERQNKRMARGLAMLFFLVIIINAKSATVLIACAVVFFIFAMSHCLGAGNLIARNLWFVVVASVLSAPLLIITPGLLDLVVELLGREDFERSTFAVRVLMWEQLIKMGMERPLLGFGPNGLSGESGILLSVSEDSKLLWQPKQAHNGYLELFLSYGLVGMGLFLWFLWRCIQEVRKSRYSIFQKQAMLMYLVYFLLISNSYASLFSQVSLPWFTVSVVLLLGLNNGKIKPFRSNV